MRVIEIPHRRVLEMDKSYFDNNFMCVNENGDSVGMSEALYLVVRNSDSKVFKLAEFVPYGWKGKDCVYLEEL